MKHKKLYNVKGKRTKLQYTFKNDILFKMMFRDNPHLLKRLISVLLEIPIKNITLMLINNKLGFGG